ncbi:piggyBac transposable element-derived protein 2-like isoform X1 [Aphis craccivora]|uniref:PiggyBac transposable element-derived protein 2-like isoform X1 n=1 Tax=Aphis craccivora TaxID=307492 RepID=A0A6G0VZP3_APHCR|nr:piggyBac transposable element-derived protein 2-like isoform X1 [Aphis craccivora]
MAKHQIQNWLEEIDTEISDYDLSDKKDLEQLLENNNVVLENNDFLENFFDGTDQIFENVCASPEVDDSEIDQNLLDEEPCCSTQSKPKKVIRKWNFEKKILLLPILIGKVVYPNPPTEEYIPLQHFKLFFSNEIFELIRLETNKYNIQKNTFTANISYSEIQQYVRILVFMGVVKMPATRLNRFSTISHYFHVEDNTTAKGPGSVNYEKLHKVRPLLNILQSNMHDLPPEERHSVDEKMIAFKGRSHLKQYVRNKLDKWGFKVFTQSKLMYDFEIYQGKGTCPETELGFSGEIVMFLLLQLSVALKERQIFSIGTVRQDRMGKCPLQLEKGILKKGRESYDFKVETENNISLVRWFDRKSINFLSTYTSVEPLGTCKRWSMSDKKFNEVPHVVEDYNKFIGGVDFADMLLELYRIDIRSNKWKEKLKMSLLEFQTNIASALCEVTKTRKRGRPSAETVNSTTEMLKKKKLILHQHQYLISDSMDIITSLKWKIYNYSPLMTIVAYKQHVGKLGKTKYDI